MHCLGGKFDSTPAKYSYVYSCTLVSIRQYAIPCNKQSRRVSSLMSSTISFRHLDISLWARRSCCCTSWLVEIIATTWVKCSLLTVGDCTFGFLLLLITALSLPLVKLRVCECRELWRSLEVLIEAIVEVYILGVFCKAVKVRLPLEHSL